MNVFIFWFRLSCTKSKLECYTVNFTVSRNGRSTFRTPAQNSVRVRQDGAASFFAALGQKEHHLLLLFTQSAYISNKSSANQPVIASGSERARANHITCNDLQLEEQNAVTHGFELEVHVS